jgi:uncharacterized membrane protein
MMPAMPSTLALQGWTRALALAALLALIVLGLAWELWPLAWPLAGVALGRLYSFRVLSLLVWPYFAEGVVRATSDGGLSVPLAAAQAGLALLLFAACVMHIRMRSR